jgi:hypothetical protein
MGNTSSFKREFGFIVVGAIIFTASLLWKDTIVEFEEVYFPKTEGLSNRLIFTIIVTIILVIIAVHLKGLLGLNKPLPTDINQLQGIHLSDDPNDYIESK